MTVTWWPHAAKPFDTWQMYRSTPANPSLRTTWATETGAAVEADLSMGPISYHAPVVASR